MKYESGDPYAQFEAAEIKLLQTFEIDASFYPDGKFPADHEELSGFIAEINIVVDAIAAAKKRGAIGTGERVRWTLDLWNIRDGLNEILDGRNPDVLYEKRYGFPPYRDRGSAET